MRLLCCLSLIFFTGCDRDSHKDLISIKRDFIKTIFDENADEGPFNMSYSLRTVFFSKEIISLFGEVDVYTNLPHSWGFYEGKTYCKINNKFKEISLNDIFTTAEQKEFLRNYCEKDLKQQSCNYFNEEDPLCTQLKMEDIDTFVVNDKCLIVIFQPYCVGSYVDGPFVVKIPYEDLKTHWNPNNPLVTLFPVKTFISSWDREDFYYESSEQVSVN